MRHNSYESTRNVSYLVSEIQGEVWQPDRTGYSKTCDENGWTYGNNYLQFVNKSSTGSCYAEGCIIRRRKWIAPLPANLLKYHRRGDDSAYEKATLIEDDRIIWDLLETEVVAPPVTSMLFLFVPVVSHFNLYYIFCRWTEIGE